MTKLENVVAASEPYDIETIKSIYNGTNASEVGSSIETMLFQPGHKVMVINANITADAMIASFKALAVVGNSTLQFKNSIFHSVEHTKSEIGDKDGDDILDSMIILSGSSLSLGNATVVGPMAELYSDMVLHSAISGEIRQFNDLEDYPIKSIDDFSLDGLINSGISTIKHYVTKILGDLSIDKLTLREFHDLEKYGVDSQFKPEIFDENVAILKKEQDAELLENLFDCVDSEGDLLSIAYREDLDCIVISTTPSEDSEDDPITLIIGGEDVDQWQDFIDNSESASDLGESVSDYLLKLVEDNSSKELVELMAS